MLLRCLWKILFSSWSFSDQKHDFSFKCQPSSSFSEWAWNGTVSTFSCVECKDADIHVSSLQHIADKQSAVLEKLKGAAFQKEQQWGEKDGGSWWMPTCLTQSASECCWLSPLKAEASTNLEENRDKNRINDEVF